MGPIVRLGDGNLSRWVIDSEFGGNRPRRSTAASVVDFNVGLVVAGAKSCELKLMSISELLAAATVPELGVVAKK